MNSNLFTVPAARISVALFLAASFFVCSGCKSETDSSTSPATTSSNQPGGSGAAAKKERAKIGYLGGQEERQTRGAGSE